MISQILFSFNNQLENENKKCVNLNNVAKLILELILNDPALTLKISIAIDKTKGTAERYLKSLQEKGYIERSGSDKNRNDYFHDTIRELTEFEKRFFNSIIIINNLLFLSSSLLSKIIHFFIFRYI